MSRRLGRELALITTFSGVGLVLGCSAAPSIPDLTESSEKAEESGGHGSGGKGTGGTTGSSTGGASTSGGQTTGGAATGGTSGASTGGRATGGMATGGNSTGGTVGLTGGASPTGGNRTGGTTGSPTGGVNTTGGQATGGAYTGGISGAASGGRATGGAPTGGTSTGGSPTGGTSTGGRPTGGSSTGGNATGGSATGGSSGNCQNFSFFLTSLAAMQRLSGSSNGFGGDLRHGQADGLSGADKICAEIAATSLPCASSKTWRAFLSTSTVDAIDRIGSGPWYDRNGLKVWNSLSEMTADRPPTSYTYRDDLPNEDGIPNHDYDLDGTITDDDNHDVLTGSDTSGRKVSGDTAASRCNDWTSTTVTVDAGTGFPGFMQGPWCGHSWPRMGSGTHWIHSIQEGGCGACVNLMETGGATTTCVGSGGGYGGIYCFALTP